MQISLLSKLKQGEQQEFVEKYKNCKWVRDTISKVLIDKLEQAIKDSEKPSSYLLPNWKKYQADLYGYRRALREVLTLLDQQE